MQLEEELSHPPLSLVRYKKHISVLEHCVRGLSEIDLQEHACRLLNAVLAPFSSNVDFETQENVSVHRCCAIWVVCAGLRWVHSATVPSFPPPLNSANLSTELSA